MLSKLDLTELPPRFGEYMGKAINVILTGHFYSVSINPTSVGANTTSEQTFTVVGLKTTDVVVVNKPSHQTGLGIVGARVSAANTLAITFMNTTGAGIDPSSETYTILAIREEKE